MSRSIVDIVNIGLVRAGATTITSIDDWNRRQSKNAQVMGVLWPYVRDEVLQAYPWKFATKWFELAKDSTDPIARWACQYPVPADCLRVLDVIPWTDTGSIPVDYTSLKSRFTSVDFAFEGRNILTNYDIDQNGADPLFLQYVASVTDPSLYDPMFIKAAALRIGSDAATSLQNSSSLAQALMQEYQMVLVEAKALDAMGQGSQYGSNSTDWVDAGSYQTFPDWVRITNGA